MSILEKVSTFGKVLQRNAAPAQHIVMDQRILPFDVRYALSHNNAEFGPQEITQMAGTGFTHEALYLTLKGLSKDPITQSALLSDVVFLTRTGAKPQELSERVMQEAQALSPETHVPAAKIAQFSRQGFDYWDKLFKNAASGTAASDRTPILMAYATLTGLPYFAQTHEHFQVVIDGWINDPHFPYAGYDIYPASNDPVRFTDKNTPKPDKPLFVDDTIKTGTHLKQLMEYWDGGKTSPTADNTLILDTVPLMV